MTKDALLKSLYLAENDICEIYPISQHHTELHDHLIKLNNILAVEEENIHEAKVQGIMYIVAGIVCFIVSRMKFLLAFFFIFATISALGCGIVKLLSILKEKNEINKTQKMIAETEEAIAQSDALLNQKCRELVGLQLWKSMMPQECLIPQYARKFISFIETDQATTLAEARNLFDLFLHREKMEGLAAKQIEALQASNAAILAAANRAADAANAAASATRDLNQTANYIRSK